MNLYREQRAAQQKRMNEFLGAYAFFAFDERQFSEGLEKLGIAPGTDGALVSIPGGGLPTGGQGASVQRHSGKLPPGTAGRHKGHGHRGKVRV